MKKSKLKIFFLLLPQVLVTLVLMLGVLNGLLQSLGYIPALGLEDLSLKYYVETIRDPAILKSLAFSLWLALASASLACLIGLLITYLFLKQKNLGSWVGRMVELPVIVPHILVALFILQFFSRTGILARILFALGFENAQDLVGGLVFDPAGKGVILAYLWKEVPFVIFFTYSLISKVNGSLGEAAQVLGASKWQAYIHVIVPLCRKTILIAYFIIFTFAFGAYELPSLLGPTLPKALPEASYIQYTHPDLRTRPYAMAINGWILILSLFISLILALVISWPDREKRRKDHEKPKV